MSRDLGFRILDVHKQWVLPIADVDPEALEELQAELGFVDLTRSDDADPTLARIFTGLRPSAQTNAAASLSIDTSPASARANAAPTTTCAH